MKKVYKDNRRLDIGQQPETKSGRRPANKPRINRLSPERFVPLLVYRVAFVRASTDALRRVFVRSFGGFEKRLFSGRTDPSASYPVLFRSASPFRVRRPGPTRPLYVRVFDSTG